jgi:hypothetical protein
MGVLGGRILALFCLMSRCHPEQGRDYGLGKCLFNADCDKPNLPALFTSSTTLSHLQAILGKLLADRFEPKKARPNSGRICLA